jgi:hypothetical protein
MWHDLPDLIRCTALGVAGGVVSSALLLIWHSFRGRSIRRHRGSAMKIHQMPGWVWITGVLMFGGASVGSVATKAYSFAVFFAYCGAAYLCGLIYSLALQYRKT